MKLSPRYEGLVIVLALLWAWSILLGLLALIVWGPVDIARGIGAACMILLVYRALRGQR
jgi:hypothetical protein